MGLEMNQKVGEYSTVMGWYGKCGDTVCDPIELSDHASIIHQVFQWSTDAVTAKSFVSDAPPELNDFTTLECGKAYLIYLKPALNSGSINTLTLEHFVSSSSEDENLGGVGEPECLTEVLVTTLAAPALVDATTLEVPAEVTTELTNALLATEGTTYVKIDENTPIEETAEISASGSFILTSGLLYEHQIGATLRTFVTEVQLTGIPADPGASLDAPTIDSALGADIDCESLALGTDAWMPDYQSARIQGQFDTYTSDYIQWTAGRDGVLESIDILMNNSFNLPGAEIRGYILENNGPDTTDTVRWTITYDMIVTAMSDAPNQVTHSSGTSSPWQHATFAWVNVPIKGSIGQKKGVKYKMQIAADTYQVDGQTHTSGWINAGHKFGMIATGNKNKLASENRPDIFWRSSSFGGVSNSFPFIRTHVGCNTTFTCNGDWYDNSLDVVTAGVCYDEDVTTVDIDDNNGENEFGGHYVYQGEIKKAVYNTPGNQTTLIDVPYYLRDGNVASSYNADFGFLNMSGSAFAHTGIKPSPGRYKKIVGQDSWQGPDGTFYRDSDDHWIIVDTRYPQGHVKSTGTSSVMNASVLESTFWGSHDVTIETGTGTGDYMLYRQPSSVDGGVEVGDYAWMISEFDPEDGKISSPYSLAYTSWSTEAKCLMDMAEDHGSNGKLTLFTPGSKPNSEILVDPTAGPSGPGGNTGPGPAETDFLRLFKKTDGGEPQIRFIDDDNSFKLTGTYEIDADTTGFIYSSTYNGDGTGPAGGSMLTMFNDTTAYPTSPNEYLFNYSMNDAELGYTFLVKSSWFTENSDAYDFFANNLPLKDGNLKITETSNFISLYADTSSDALGGSYFRNMRGSRTLKFSKAQDFDSESSVQTVKEWAGNDDLFVVGYFYNPAKDYNSSTDQYYNIGTFTFASQSGMERQPDLIELNSVTELTQSGGQVTTYLAEDTTAYAELVKAIDFWNSALEFPGEHVAYMANRDEDRKIKLDVYVEDYDVDNDTLGMTWGAALYEATIGRGGFMAAGGDKVGGNFSFGKTFPSTGYIRLNRKFMDSNYFTTTNNSGQTGMFSVVRHEIAHVLGINGTIFGSAIPDRPITSYVEDAKTKYYYHGTHGLAAYKSCISDGGIAADVVGIPLEDDGSGNSAGSHWEEGDDDDSANDRYINGKFHPGLDNETMTPYDDTTDVLSIITLGVMKDLGYIVNDSKAEPFTISVTGTEND